MKSYINLFRNYANFSGFLKRKPFWTAVFFHLLILLIPLVPGIFFVLNKNSLLPGALDLANPEGILTKIYVPWVMPIWCFYFLLTRIPLLSACVRRLHTLPRKGWWMLLGLIPAAGWFILLIWLLQKGTYEDFEKRLIKAGVNNDLAQTVKSALLAAAEKPRNGRWFFVFFAILAACGFFLNRQIRQTGSVTAAMEEIRASVPKDWADLKFWDQKSKPAMDAAAPDQAENMNPADSSETGIEAPGAAATSGETEPEDMPVVPLRAIPGEPVISRKQFGDSASLGTDFFKTHHLGLYLAGDGVLADAKAVTAGYYRLCVEDGACEMPPELNTMAYRNMISEGDQNTDSDHNAGSLPMVYVTRDQAAAYCGWLGMRLPTADEWREAAKNSSVETWTPENANCAGTDRSEYIKTEDQLALTVTVGAFEQYASDYGMVQMAGNVWEWVTSEDEPEGTALALGGSWNSYPENLGPDAELRTLAGYSADNIGFRCFADESALTSDLFEGGEPVTEAEPQEIEAEEISEETAKEETGETAAAEITAEEIQAEEIQAEEIETIPADDAGVSIISGTITQIDDPGVEIISGTIGVIDSSAEEAAAGDSQTMIRPQDNAPMVYIPAGSFSMGASGGAVDEKPVHDVSLSAFWMDVYEVTNARYALCVAEGVCTEPHETKSFRNPSYYGNPDFDNYPVIYVDWQQASDYCSWTGSQLPTEAQWEYAAKGPDGNRYPWGNTFEGSKLNYSGNGNYDTLAVDANPEDVSAFGVYDLGGNVSEWTADRYLDNWYTVTDQPKDPTGPEAGPFRVIRGGSTQTGENNVRTADRFYAKENTFNLDRGFRCVRPDR